MGKRRAIADLVEAGERRTAMYTVLRLPGAINVQQFSAESGMTVEAVRKACQRGAIRAEKNGSSWRIPREELIPYVVERIKTCNSETLELMKSRSGRIA